MKITNDEKGIMAIGNGVKAYYKVSDDCLMILRNHNDAVTYNDVLDIYMKLSDEDKFTLLLTGEDFAILDAMFKHIQQ